MDTNRRDFLKGTAWMGAAAVAAGCMNQRAMSLGGCCGAPMQGWADKPMAKVRVGVIGLGRGMGAATTFPKIPGTEVTAVAELPESQARIDKCMKWYDDNKIARPKLYCGPEGYKALCESDNVDLVYNATPWELHTPIGLYAMEHGKHVVIEVPSALTLEQCWALVETSERTKRHCMQLENCCYGEEEMLAKNLCAQGLMGELVHGEGAYIHDLRSYCYNDYDPANKKYGYWQHWRLRYNAAHGGNQYETHGLGPICIDMNINRGDKFDYLVSMDSAQRGFYDYARSVHGADSWQGKLPVKMGDMNNTLIKTALGRTILVQHDVGNFGPYSRLNTIRGTRGVLQGYPFRVVLAKEAKSEAHGYSDKVSAQIREEYKHPLWKKAGELAKKAGGHGGMDFLMQLRLSYCLQNGLPLDMNVYDLAAWCSLGELTEKSCDNRGRPMDVPDFTRGAWKTTKPFGIWDIDLAKVGSIKA